MTSLDSIALLALPGGAVLLVAVNVALQRLARSGRIAGCCGMAVPCDVTAQGSDSRWSA